MKGGRALKKRRRKGSQKKRIDPRGEKDPEKERET